MSKPFLVAAVLPTACASQQIRRVSLADKRREWLLETIHEVEVAGALAGRLQSTAPRPRRGLRSSRELKSGASLKIVPSLEVLASLEGLTLVFAVTRIDNVGMLRGEDNLFKKAHPVLTRAPRDDQILMVLTEFTDLRKGDTIAHVARFEFMPFRFQQSLLDPPMYSAEPHSQMHRELAQRDSVSAQLRIFLAVQEIIEALRVTAEPLRGGVDAMVRDVLDQFIHLLALECVPFS